MKLILLCIFALALGTVPATTDETTTDSSTNTATMDQNTDTTTATGDETTTDSSTNTATMDQNTDTTTVISANGDVTSTTTDYSPSASNTSNPDGTLNSTDSSDNANSTNSTNSTTPTTVKDHDITCHSCGIYDSSMKAECKTTSTNSTDDCNEKECWIYRTEKDGTAMYARGCKSEDSKVDNWKCSDYTSEECTTVNSETLCAKCCDTNSCNTGELAGGSSRPTFFNGLFLVAATFVVLLTK